MYRRISDYRLFRFSLVIKHIISFVLDRSSRGSDSFERDREHQICNVVFFIINSSIFIPFNSRSLFIMFSLEPMMSISSIMN